MNNYIPCTICGNIAFWSYMPSEENYCETHVPRGCSCTEDEHGVKELDEKGREQPCCEYNYINRPLHNDKDLVGYGWEIYYKNNPEEEINKYDQELSIQKIRKPRDKLRSFKSKPKGFKKRIKKEHID